MFDFKIAFSRPLWLILLIPVFLLSLIPLFRIPRKYRYTRNRVLSIIVHTITMILLTLLLSGMTFEYNELNDGNEIILLVDESDSNESSKEMRNEYVRQVIDSASEKFSLGIVKFGYDQVYSFEMSRNKRGAYDAYINSENPNTSATNIEAALDYSKTLFTGTDTSKIILITDGYETDGSLENSIRELLVDGITVDTIKLPKEDRQEFEIIGVTLPNYNVQKGAKCSVTLTIKANYNGSANIELYDNGEKKTVVHAEFLKGVQEIQFNDVIFETDGFHKLTFSAESNGDIVNLNNEYSSYILLENYNNILVIRRYESDTEKLMQLLGELEYNAKEINVFDENIMPKTAEDLREFDEVILVNVMNADFPQGFDEALYEYVHDFGGGLFTVGGENQEVDGKNTSIAYNHKDMVGTLFQQMLPVQAIDYTPPLGVALIIDKSGSMGVRDEVSGKTRLELAKEGAMSCLATLTERDWCSIITLSDEVIENVPMIPMTRMSELTSAVQKIESGDGTVYASAIKAAGESLKALTAVERKHIILVSDCEPADSFEEYGNVVLNNFYNYGITFSMVGITEDGASIDQFTFLCEEFGGGKFYNFFSQLTDIPKTMRNDLRLHMIEDYYDEEFIPSFDITTNLYTSDITEITPLKGYYGTKLKTNAKAPLMGNFVPIYAEWEFGNGHVGSFMSDLNGHWSEYFMQNESCRLIARNMINSNLPTESIRQKPIELVLNEDNYSNQLSIFTKMDPTDYISLEISKDGELVDSASLLGSENYSRYSFSTIESGVFKINAKKYNELGELLGEDTVYKTLPYSKEYDYFDETDVDSVLSKLSEKTGGMTTNEVYKIFDSYDITVHRSINPAIPFLIVILVFILLDIAIRKFKFRWIHEIIRDYKIKKGLGGEKNE